MKKLTVGSTYTRKDVYEIFDNGVTRFTRGSGTWGIQGIVKIPDRTKDYVFFVTYGQNKLGQEFEEHISQDGTIIWKSQKKMDFDNKHIKNFLNHNHNTDNIYLFYRTDNKSDFIFKGKLAYISHDPVNINPVIIKWKLIEPNFPYNQETINETSSIIKEKKEKYRYSSTPLEITAPPNSNDIKEIHSFNASIIDYEEVSRQRNEIGLLGELLAIELLEAKFKDASKNHLINSIVHTSLVEGDGAGYDIRFLDENGNPNYIEVKTTTKGIDTRFFVSRNELKFSESSNSNYHLFRIYNLSLEDWHAKCYITHGSLWESYNLNPMIYSALFDNKN